MKEVLEREYSLYEDYLKELIRNHPEASEDELAWMVIEKLAVDGAKTLEPVFNSLTGEGRLSIQTNTKYYNNVEKLLEQAVYFFGAGAQHAGKDAGDVGRNQGL